MVSSFVVLKPYCAVARQGIPCLEASATHISFNLCKGSMSVEVIILDSILHFVAL